MQRFTFHFQFKFSLFTKLLILPYWLSTVRSAPANSKEINFRFNIIVSLICTNINNFVNHFLINLFPVF